MATTATNKQALFRDRPLLAVRGMNLTSSSSSSVDPGSGVAALMVDCSAEEGAIIDDIYIVQRVNGNTTKVNLWIGTSSASLNAGSAWFIGRFGFTVGGDIGATTRFTLPRILAPVPHAGANDADGNPPQFRGLLMEKGQCLYAAAASDVTVANAPNLVVMGGYY